MADFQKAIGNIFLNEGRGYVNIVGDPGGPTKFGISLRFLQNISPERLERYGIFGTVTSETIRNLTPEQAKNIYRGEFWDKYEYEKIHDQSIATKLFDLCVNVGPNKAHIIIQRAVRAATNFVLEEDGILGIHSLTLINMCKPFMLMPALKAEAACYYRSIKYVGSEKFLNGWLNRAYSTPILEDTK